MGIDEGQNTDHLKNASTESWSVPANEAANAVAEHIGGSISRNLQHSHE
jgi:D-alanyl-D-alanine carboxypeptidase